MNINQIRKEMGFSQQELAGWLGLSRRQVAKPKMATLSCPTNHRKMDKEAKKRSFASK